MEKFKYKAIILTAGESSRMGFPKALLDSGDGRKFLERIIDNVGNNKNKPEEIIVVLGYHKEKICDEVNLEGCTIVENKTPELGQLSSLIAALNNIKDDMSGVLMCLVDHPLVSPSTYEKVAKEALSHPGSIILPRYGKRKGHPVFFPSEIFKDLKTSPLDCGARYAVQKNKDRIRIIDIDDPGILKDIDTPEEYQRAVNREQGAVSSEQ